MVNSAIKKFTLPFSPAKSGEPFNSEVEVATVYALAELERAKSGGLVLRQSEEKLLFITEIGYPIWLFPNNTTAFIFDGLNNSSYSIPYSELPNAQTFLDSLEKHSKTREDYLIFLSDHRGYFLQPAQEKEFLLRNLIADLDFKKEFDIYRKEAAEISGQFTKFALLSPTLPETTISSMMAEMNKVQLSLKEEAQQLSECLSRVNKSTSQYVTELAYDAEAVKDEADAKIKAQEEIVNPQILKLNRDCKLQIAKVTRSLDEEISKLYKLNVKTLKFIDADEKKLKQYEKQAKKQAQKNHLIYEKSWKSKSRETKKELSGLKKELKRTENSVKNLNKQKNQKIAQLQLELDTEVKLARQPLLDLEASRNSKMLIFKQETEKLLNQEKPLLEELNGAIKLAEDVNARFQTLGIRNPQLKTLALFYVPFYAACYQAGLSQRYLFLTPSMTNSIGFAAKLKGAMGISKIKQTFTPRFKTITNLIEKVQTLTKQDSLLEHQIINSGERNNLLKNELALVKIAKGLDYLKDAGWLSSKEHQGLSNSLEQS